MKKRTFITVLSFLLALTIFFQVMPENIVRAEEISEVENVITETTEQKEAEILYEIEERRESAVKHFQMSDGSVMAAVYSDVVHKEDENGKLVDIDNTLEENGDAYQTVDGIFNVSFAKKPKSNKMVEINYNGYEISFGVEKIKSNSAKVKNGAKNNKSSLTQTTSQARYDGAFDGIDLVYDLTGSKIKESIVINEYTGINEFTFIYRFGDLDPVLNDDGSVELFDGETKVLEIQAPFMFDSIGAESDDVTVTLTKHGSKYNYTLSASEEWLTAEERIYPVTIDPTVETGGRSTIYDTYVTPQEPTAIKAGRDRLLVGTSNGGTNSDKTYGPYRTYIWFEMPEIPSGSRVTDARLRLSPHPNEWTNYEDIENNICIELYEILDNTVAANNLTWNNQDQVSLKENPTDYQCLRTGALSSDDEKNYYTWNVTSLIDRYYTMAKLYPNYMPGMMLKYADETIENNDFFAGFYSSESSDDIPTITIYYSDVKGIEGYYDYFASSLDDSGVGYVNAFNGSLNYVNTIIAESGTRLPATVSAYYNSANVDNATSGWNFSFNQTLVYDSERDEPFYAYTDADGTVHYFREYGGIFVDETGSGLYIDQDSPPYGYETIDIKIEGQKAKTVFTKVAGGDGDTWYLSKVEDGLGNTQTYEYDGSTIASITDGAGRIINIRYSGDKVTNITDAAGKTTTFEYSGNKITKINYPNGKSVTFKYHNDSEYIYQIIASTGAKITYHYNVLIE